jgi:hypothetical protein
MFRRFGIYVYAGVLVVLVLAGVLFELLLSELATLAGR